MRRIPIVGVTAGCKDGRISLATEYVRVLTEVGAVAMILPMVETKEAIWYQSQAIDGLVLSGGGDVSPLLYGQEPAEGIGQVDSARDRWEMALCRLIIQQKKPLLGICRGMQVLNIVLGGDVYPDIRTQAGRLSHWQTSEVGSLWHTVHHSTCSMLERLFGSKLAVNSYHHQAVRRIGEGLTISAMATDGTVEAIEGEQGRLLGVQYHPEYLPAMRPLWQEFVEMAGEKKE